MEKIVIIQGIGMKQKKKIKISIMYDREEWSDYLAKMYDVEISDTPDYVLCESGTALKCIYQYDCIRIIRHGENLRPDFNFFDYAIGFDKISFEDRYLYYPLYMSYGNDLEKALHKHELPDDFYLKKTRFCNYVVSNGKASSVARDQMFDLINKEYKKVDSGGKYRNNLQGGQPVKDKFQFQKNYKFSLAFENSCYKGYTTEKLIQAFAAGTIPIYWGNPDVAEEFNEKAFINCHTLNSFDEVVDRVREIDRNNKLYMDMVHQPIVNKRGVIPRMLESDYLESFLCNIFDQTPEKARRRTNAHDGWGSFMERDAKRFYEWNNSTVLGWAERIHRNLLRRGL